MCVHYCSIVFEHYISSFNIPAISFNAENRLPSTGYILTMLNNRSQNVTVSSLFPCYAGDIFFSNFLDAYRSCVVISSA